MTNCKRIYAIAELFNDDMAVVSTAVKIFHKEEHKVILNHLINGDTERYSLGIVVLYDLISDNYNVDGVVALIEALHSHTVHGVDSIRSNIATGITVGDDLSKGVQLKMFGDE